MFEIQIDDRQIQSAFARLSRAVDDQTGAMRDIGEYMTRRVDSGFRDEKDFYGNPWAPLSARTVKRKQKNRQIQKVLQSSGLFRSSFSYTANSNSVEIGSNRVSRSSVPIGILHQLGSRRMPARPTLPDARRGLPPADSQEIVDIIGDHIGGAW